MDKLKGKRGVNPYAVCQASTGQSFATGKPLKGKKDMPEDEEIYEGEDIPEGEVNERAPDDQMEPPPEPGHGPGEGSEMMDEEPQEEAYGAQVHRRMHRDAMILMEEYYEMANLLENPTVKKRLDKKLELLEKEMTEIEDEFASEYGHLEGLEGAGTRPGAEEAFEEESEEEAVPELEDEEVEANSEPPEEEPEEEAAEGMDVKEKGKGKKKALSSLVRNVKAIRHAMHGKCAICGKDMAECKGHRKAHPSHMPGVQRDVHNIPGEEERQHKPGGRHRSPARHTDIGVEEHQKKPGRRHSDATLPGRPGFEEFQRKPGKRRPTLVRAKAGGGAGPVNDLTPSVGSAGQAASQAHVGHPAQYASVLPAHHKRAVANAAQYLKGVSGLLNHNDWGETHGRDAYYHARALMDAVSEAQGSLGQKAKLNINAEASPEEIAQGAAMMASMEVPNAKDMGGLPLPNPLGGMGGSSMPMPTAPGGEQQQGPAQDAGGEQKGLHPHYHTVEQAARFLGDLSQLKKDFSDSHRMAAEHWHKELDAIGREDEETEVQHPSGSPAGHPDPMQQFDATGAKALAWDIQKQREEVAATAEQFRKLMAAVGVPTV